MPHRDDALRYAESATTTIEEQRRAGRPGPHLPRPDAGECAAVFADEIALVPDTDDFVAMLRSQADTTRALAATFGETHAGVRYAPDKWSVRETIGHLSDCERCSRTGCCAPCAATPSSFRASITWRSWAPGSSNCANSRGGRGVGAVREATAALIASAAPGASRIGSWWGTVRYRSRAGLPDCRTRAR